MGQSSAGNHANRKSEIIPGVEISSIYKGIKMHILGYNFKVNDNLEDMLKDIQEKRLKRFYDILGKIQKEEGLDISDIILERVISKSESLARPQIINTLMELGYGDNRDLVYKTYVKPYKSKINYRLPLEDVIKVLKDSDAKIVIAHPREIEDEYNMDIETILPELLELGIDGIEVANSIHSLEDIRRYWEYIKKYQIDYTLGSDYHGPNVKPIVKIGKCSKEGKIIRKLSLIK